MTETQSIEYVVQSTTGLWRVVLTDKATKYFQPKPNRTPEMSFDEQEQITDGHRSGVFNAGSFFMFLYNERLRWHDFKKLAEEQAGIDHATVNAHHILWGWSKFKPGVLSKYGPTLLDVAEGFADCLATLVGRMLVGRDYDYALPSMPYSGSELVNNTILYVGDEMGVFTTELISPKEE